MRHRKTNGQKSITWLCTPVVRSYFLFQTGWLSMCSQLSISISNLCSTLLREILFIKFPVAKYKQLKNHRKTMKKSSVLFYYCLYSPIYLILWICCTHLMCLNFWLQACVAILQIAFRCPSFLSLSVIFVVVRHFCRCPSSWNETNKSNHFTLVFYTLYTSYAYFFTLFTQTLLIFSSHSFP